VTTVSRTHVLAHRWRVHQLHREPGSGLVADTALLDVGVQDTGPRGARWALANRGVSDLDDDETLLAWTIRGAPHLYRRADRAAQVVATAPLSEADAAKRVFDAAKALRGTGLPVLGALAVIAERQRAIVTAPMDKGSLSTALSGRLDAAYLRACVPCDAVHSWEQPFRLAALQAGLELEPGASPPVLRRTPGAQPGLFRTLGAEAEARFDVVRGYLRFYGPATPKDAAAFLDAPVKDVVAHWPEDVETMQIVGVDGDRSVLVDDLPSLRAGFDAPGEVRLVGPYDAWLQLRDRAVLVPDVSHAKDLWRTLGRPGAVIRDGEVVGTWRPKSSGARLTVHWDPWVRATKALATAVEGQAERLASVREQTLAGVATA
jgi:Winged helix DNA-binding domain